MKGHNQQHIAEMQRLKGQLELKEQKYDELLDRHKQEVETLKKQVVKNKLCKERHQELIDKKMKNENKILVNKLEIQNMEIENAKIHIQNIKVQKKQVQQQLEQLKKEKEDQKLVFNNKIEQVNKKSQNL